MATKCKVWEYNICDMLRKSHILSRTVALFTCIGAGKRADIISHQAMECQNSRAGD